MINKKTGRYYSVAYHINSKWCLYEKVVAQTHLDNYGCIYLDEDGVPVDNEYILEEVNDEHKGKGE